MDKFSWRALGLSIGLVCGIITLGVIFSMLFIVKPWLAASIVGLILFGCFTVYSYQMFK